MYTLADSPTEDHDKVHDVPAIPKIGTFVEHKTQGDDFYPSLKTKHPNEVGLRLLLHT